MREDSSTKSWNDIGLEWAKFSEQNDYRNHFLIPNTISMMGNVQGKYILDLGCGEGGYSRILSKMGAFVTGVDCVNNLIELAKEKSKQEGLNINYLVKNSSDLNELGEKTYDNVLASMMLMDCEDFKGTISEIYRVLKSNGRVIFSILHPCFSGQDVGWRKDDLGGFYFSSDNYFSTAPWEEEISNAFSKKVIYRHRPLQDYFSTLLNCGFNLIRLVEPVPTEEQMQASSRMKRLTRIPLFLFMEWEK